MGLSESSDSGQIGNWKGHGPFKKIIMETAKLHKY